MPGDIVNGPSAALSIDTSFYLYTTYYNQRKKEERKYNNTIWYIIYYNTIDYLSFFSVIVSCYLYTFSCYICIRIPLLKNTGSHGFADNNFPGSLDYHVSFGSHDSHEYIGSQD